MDRLVEITVTDRCNKRCSYCFEKRARFGQDSFADWLPLVVAACKESAAAGECLQISFWGGEPFLETGRMLDIIGATSGYEPVTYHVYTNGTLADETRAFVSDPRFKAVAGRFSAQVSYDGDPCNELRRGYGFGAVRESALALRGAGAKVSFKATICYGDVGLMPSAWDSYAALETDWPDIRYSPTLDSSSAPESFPESWPRAVEDVCRREFDFYRRNGRFLMSWFDDEEPRLCRLENRTCLHSDGVQYVCHGCPYSGDVRTRLGSASDGKLLFAPRQSTSGRGLCELCDASYCVQCNAVRMPPGGLADAWNAGCANPPSVCKMYRAFAWYRRALIYAIMKSK